MPRAPRRSDVLRYAWAGLLLLAATSASAVPPLVTGDVPTAEPGEIEWYVGTRYQRTGSAEWQPMTEIVYGLSSWAEATFELPFVVVDGHRGFGDAALGTKLVLLPSLQAANAVRLAGPDEARAGRHTVELIGARADGQEFPVEASFSTWSAGGESFYGCILRDIGERKRSEQEREKLRGQLLQSEKMAAVGQLAAGVAHEINNPLGVILGFAQGLDKRVPQDSPLRLAVSSIVREALRCKQLVQGLLTYSRTSKKVAESVDLNELVRASLTLFAPRCKMQGIEVAAELADGAPPILSSRTQLQQILVNLANNAIDAKAGGKLLVRTSVAGGELRLEVVDTGAGIPEDIRPRIFEPFFTTKEVGKGTGLGLSLVYEIVRQHEGSIDVQSKVGEGTAVSICLPLAAGGGHAAKAVAMAAR